VNGKRSTAHTTKRGISPQTISTRSVCRCRSDRPPSIYWQNGLTRPGHARRGPPEKNSERLVGQDREGGEREERHFNGRADHQEPDLALCLPIHVFPG